MNPITTIRNTAELVFDTGCALASDAWNSLTGGDDDPSNNHSSPESKTDLAYAPADENAEWGYDSDGLAYLDGEDAEEGFAARNLKRKQSMRRNTKQMI